MATSDDEWQPPTEAEMKVMEARRERQSQISKLMGAYLLKGYKMLGQTCSTCQTILLQDRQGVNLCVACSELDSDNVKDNPALSDEAAIRQAAEQTQRTVSCDMNADSPQRVTVTLMAEPPGNASPNPDPALIVRSDPERRVLQACDTLHSAQYEVNCGSLYGGSDNIASAVTSVKGKLAWASAELTQTTNVERSQQLCVLIKTCAETLASLNKLLSTGEGRM